MTLMRITADHLILPPATAPDEIAAANARTVAVLDAERGLLFAPLPKPAKRYSHEQALDAASALRTLGFEDWRLETYRELTGSVDIERHNPAIDTAFFPWMCWGPYWTSSPFANNPDYAWVVGLSGGSAYILLRHDSPAFARAVRRASASQFERMVQS